MSEPRRRRWPLVILLLGLAAGVTVAASRVNPWAWLITD